MPRRVRLSSDISPRPYQSLAAETALSLTQSEPDTWHLFQAPTGTGKSVMELLVMQEAEAPIFVTPRVEIIAGVLEKAGHDLDDMSATEMVKLAGSYGMFTPIRARNILAKGELPYMPSVCIIDECHHDLAETYADIGMYLNGTPKCGFTATPFRGTPRGTRAFLDQWDDTINQVLTLRDAVDQGFCTFPTARVWPLVDDDIIEVSNGEIKASAADKVITDRVDALLDRLKPFWCPRSKMWDRPTMIALPTTNLVRQVETGLKQRRMACHAVTQDTKRADRRIAFSACTDARSCLIQIDVVSEGVDLPVRRLIDCRPTLSPVKWVQQVGRIMRPSNHPPEYVCVCRNLERHGYLMEGLFPDSTIKEAQEAFPRVSKRAGIRALGLEELGRFTATPVQLTSGITVSTWNIVSTNEFDRTEYCAIVHPNHMEPTYAQRVIHRKPDGEWDWAKSRWRLIESMPDLKGYATAKPWPLTDKQRLRWNEWAEKLGLNPHREVTNRNVQVLFLLKDLGLRMS